MNATLSLEVPAEVLRRAEEEARRHRTTVSELVARQLEVLALNWETSVAGKSPITDSLRGVVSLPPGLEVKDVVIEERLRKLAE